MHHVRLTIPDYPAWRREARRLLDGNVPPERVVWSDGGVLFGNEPVPDDAPEPAVGVRVPPAFVSAARRVVHHRDADKYPLLYRVLWRLTRGGEPHLLEVAVDDDVHRLNDMDKSVRRDAHKMHAFVRFRRVTGDGHAEVDANGQPDGNGGHYVAWHRPDHPIVRLVASFFKERFGVMRWTILTPDESASWDGSAVTFGPGVPHRLAPAPDELEAMWKTYYSSIFNPARVKVRAMKREMPVRHWATLPEAELIDDLLREAPKRVEAMVKKAKAASRPCDGPGMFPDAEAGNGNAPTPRSVSARMSVASKSGDPSCETPWTARSFVPASRELPVLATAAAACKGCDLYCHATQTVFGEGPANARVVMVGEQPGDSEDRAGRPFVGPAGQLLNDVMERVGLPRDAVYVTNAVKHFKFEPRGTRRIHAKPSAREVTACRPWLEAELQAVRPPMLVCLGSTAAQSLLGRDFRVTQSRGRVMRTDWAPWTIATIHPSALLRIPDPALRERSMAEFESDLRQVAVELKRILTAG